MDTWKFYDITHREHLFCNPMSEEKFQEFISLLRLKEGAQVLDIATGKGEFIIRLAEQYGIRGIGIDISPYCIREVSNKHQRRKPDADLRFLEMDGAGYEPERSERFDLAACIGASWIYGGHMGTLKALYTMAADESWIVAGEPFWNQEPPPEYLEATGLKRGDLGTHYENAEAGREIGLELAYTLVSNQDDWDKYEGLQWYAAESWAKENPDDPDVDEVLKRVRKDRESFLRWGRDALGWAIYVFSKQTANTGEAND